MSREVALLVLLSGFGPGVLGAVGPPRADVFAVPVSRALGQPKGIGVCSPTSPRPGRDPRRLMRKETAGPAGRRQGQQSGQRVTRRPACTLLGGEACGPAATLPLRGHSEPLGPHNQTALPLQPLAAPHPDRGGDGLSWTSRSRPRRWWPRGGQARLTRGAAGPVEGTTGREAVRTPACFSPASPSVN